MNVDALTYAGNPLSIEVRDAANYRFIHADIRDAARVAELVRDEQPSHIVHFAAESHVDRSILGPADFVHTNVIGTFNVLEACRAHAPTARFHHVSTDEVYGSLGSEGLFLETTAYDPSSPYSASKAASDHFVRAYHRTYGIGVTISNCSNNYGPYQFPEKLIPLMIANARDGEALPIYGDGLNVRDWLHVHDHCDAIWTILEGGKLGETYNVGGDCERNNLEVVDAICREVAARKGIQPETVLALKRFVKDRPGHDRRYAIDASKLRRELGWKPAHSFESGLRETVGWYWQNDDWSRAVRTGAYRKWIAENYAGRASANGG